VHTLVALLPSGVYFGGREPPEEATLVLSYDVALTKLSPDEQLKLQRATRSRNTAVAATPAHALQSPQHASDSSDLQPHSSGSSSSNSSSSSKGTEAGLAKAAAGDQQGGALSSTCTKLPAQYSEELRDSEAASGNSSSSDSDAAAKTGPVRMQRPAAAADSTKAIKRARPVLWSPAAAALVPPCDCSQGLVLQCVCSCRALQRPAEEVAAAAAADATAEAQAAKRRRQNSPAQLQQHGWYTGVEDAPALLPGVQAIVGLTAEESLRDLVVSGDTILLVQFTHVLAQSCSESTPSFGSSTVRCSSCVVAAVSTIAGALTRF
jgi:hypothetical protein